MTVVINGTTGISGVDGSAGTPAVQGTDTNTGVFYPAADTVAVSTGGSERMRIDSSGNVGIGTSSPFTGGLTIDSAAVGAGAANLYFKSQGADADEGVWRQRAFNSAGSCYFEIAGLNDAVSSGAIAWRVIKNNGNIIDQHQLYTNGSERMRIDSSGNLLFNSGYGSVATAYGCRAWVNFNGTGTVAIRASGNVTSITDNGTGNYTVNFTTAMPDANYAATFAHDHLTSYNAGYRTQSYTTTSVQVLVSNGSTAYVDAATCSVSIFR